MSPLTVTHVFTPGLANGVRRFGVTYDGIDKGHVDIDIFREAKINEAAADISVTHGVELNDVFDKLYAAIDEARGKKPTTKPTATPGIDPEVVIENMADIDAREITWLWPNRIPSGRITLIVGRPGDGKSFLSTYIAATVSKGRMWVDGEPCEQGKVVLIAGEDDPGDTIRPRLESHGADVNKINMTALRGVQSFRFSAATGV